MMIACVQVVLCVSVYVGHESTGLSVYIARYTGYWQVWNDSLCVY